ncbi:MAG: Hsp20/alpha crystallin family protein [Burkholderiales bacterium]|nr:Hsp20/alpha crystallin family protein [Opitutaceae bacterium]
MSLISSLIPSFAGAPEKNSQDGATTAAASNDPGPTAVPRYQVNETPEAYGLTVELPGVAKDGLELSVDHEQIRVFGRRAWRKPEAWTALHRETRDFSYELVLEHGRVIDTDKVHAELRDGVLRVSLPKVESRKPRKVAVA